MAATPPPLDRALFPVTERCTYLNVAHTCAPPTPVVEAVAGAVGRQATHGSRATADNEDAIEGVRAAAAGLMGVPVTDVAFVKNTTEGLSFLASGLDWAAGDRVLLPEDEFPSTAYPWLALEDRGVVVDRVAPDGLGAAVDSGPPPRVVATSWVRYERGRRADLPALGRACREAGALLCVDAIQGLGLLPADFEAWGVDVAAAAGHKWLLGPEGAGVLYVRGERLEHLRVLEPGWHSAADRDAYDDRALVLDPTARRFEGGRLNAPGILGLGAAIDLLTTTGVDRIWEHVDALCDRLVDGVTSAGATVLSDRSPTTRSGIVSVAVPGHDPVAVRDTLLAEGVVASARAGGVRLSPHGYTTTEEIDAAVVALGRLG